ncbi:hypothetical protein B0H13DRAFT_1899414 [Mycena leptocephala]|nr:hypothetical protein B0H13DRAFT_1899414 [Mycena leptocephala]
MSGKLHFQTIIKRPHTIYLLRPDDPWRLCPAPTPLPNPGLPHKKRLKRQRHGQLDVLPIVVLHERPACIGLSHPCARVAFADARGGELRRGVGSRPRVILGIVLPRQEPSPTRLRQGVTDEEGGEEEHGERRGRRRRRLRFYLCCWICSASSERPSGCVLSTEQLLELGLGLELAKTSGTVENTPRKIISWPLEGSRLLLVQLLTRSAADTSKSYATRIS